MKIENKKGGYDAAVVKPTNKDLGGRLKSLLNKHGYEVAIGVEKHSKNYLHETAAQKGQKNKLGSKNLGLVGQIYKVQSGWCLCHYQFPKMRKKPVSRNRELAT